MNSRIYSGVVEHLRHHPTPHGFRTPVTFYAFDLSEFATLDQHVSGFAFNHGGPLSLREAAYLAPGDGTFEEKLAPWIELCGLEQQPDRITLVTSPKWFGYSFNPVSFYILQREGEPVGLISEVNNTFGDRHVYAVPLEKVEGIAGHRHDKEFHVSPFNNMKGEYQFTVRQDGDHLYVGVDLYRDGVKILDAWIEGDGIPLTSGSLWKTNLLHPLRPWLTMPRIVWQAVLLKYKRKLEVFKRPEPAHPNTLLSRHQERKA